MQGRWQPRKGDKKRVVVVGGGIAGMTAAHELVERGYEVEVVEMAVDPYGDPAAPSPRLGGMARTSWAAVPASPPPMEEAPPRRAAAASPEARGDGPRHLHLDASPLPITVPLAGLIPELETPARGFLDRVPPGESLSVIASRPLSEVERRQLQVSLRSLGGRWRLTVVENGRKGDSVQLAVDSDRVPGEHGFRFFPSFYRHLFDTMKRIPIAEAAIGPDAADGTTLTTDSARTVFDALRSAEVIELGLLPEGSRTRSFGIARRPMVSPEEIRRFFAGVLERAGYRGQDLYRLATRYAEYLTSAPERRTREYERISWAQFLGLDEGGFSQYFGQHVVSGAQALVAMSSKTNDARTIGSIAMQLTLDQVRANPGSYTDATLRGPTSVELFDPWQAYLESEGVRFSCAQLVGFHGQGMAVRPAFGLRAPSDPAKFTYVEVAPADYYVLTVPVDVFQALFDSTDAGGAPAAGWVDGGESGAPELLSREALLSANRLCLELDGYERYGDDDFARAENDDIGKYLAFPVGDFASEPDRGPLRNMCGIQFYFAADVKVVVGHTICLDSAWGVSYISQAQYWQHRRRGRGGVRGVISAIFTLFEVPAPDRDGQSPKTALECSAAEIAERIWVQIADTWNVEEHGELPEPDAFFLDESLRRDGGRWTNTTPYLVNQVGDWERRGGARTPDGDYEYRIQLGHTVFAGAFLRTWTRLNTMEAANESGRRAVNAILSYDGASAQPCKVWDLEDHEIPELLPLRDLDERILRRGGHHLLRHGAVDAALRGVPWDLVRLGLPTGGTGGPGR